MQTNRCIIGLIALILWSVVSGIQAKEIPVAPSNFFSEVNRPIEIVAADLNGDGVPDLVTGSGASPNELVWAYNNLGSLPPFFHSVVCSGCDDTKGIDVGDLNGDGHLDIVATFDDDNFVGWYTNNGVMLLPSFGQNAMTTILAGASGVAVGDLDRDGDMDVVAVGRSSPSTVLWFENDGAGVPTFITHTVSTNLDSAAGVELEDLNCDGVVDVVVMEQGQSRVVSFMQQGGGSVLFTTNILFSNAVGLANFDVADLDRDGDQDIVSAWGGSDTIAWAANDGSNTPSFAVYNIATTLNDPFDVFIADLDQDGDDDVVASTSLGGELSWYESDGASLPTFVEHSLYFTNAPNGITVADMDGDGDLDIVSTSAGGGVDDDVFMLRNDTVHRNALFSRECDISLNTYGAVHAVAADVDKDGDLDVVAAGSPGEQVHWFVNDGAGNVSSATNIITSSATNVRRVAVGDMDRDGDIDIVSAVSGADRIEWYEQTNSMFTTNLVRADVDGAYDVALIDLDRDGDVDIVSCAESLDEVVWYDSDGAADPSFTTRLISSNATLVKSVAVADLDRDGDLDVVAAPWGDNEVVWYEADTNVPPNFTTNVAVSGINGPQHVAIHDVDGDGDLDILVAADSDDEILWLENSGAASPTFSENVISANAQSPRFVYAGDFDLDGDVDVVSASESDNKIAWYESNGAANPTFVEHVISTNALAAQSVMPADLDGDGDQDLLVSSYTEDKVAWHKNGGGQFAMLTTNMASIIQTNGNTATVFSISFIHRGRTGDTEIAFESMELFFGRAVNGIALSEIQANALVSNVTVYLDDGSGVFEMGSDHYVTNLQVFSLSSGTQTVSIAEGATNVISSIETSATLFVVAQLATNAEEQALDAFLIGHRTESSSTANDIQGIPLDMEFVTNESATMFFITDTSDFDGDGMPDAWELDQFGHPTNETAGGDVDSDFMDNLSEYISDTDPGDSNSLHYVTGITNVSPTNTFIYFHSSTARVYSLQFNEGLLITNGWTNVTSQTGIPGVDGPDSLMDTNAPAANSNRNYRVNVAIP